MECQLVSRTALRGVRIQYRRCPGRRLARQHAAIRYRTGRLIGTSSGELVAAPCKTTRQTDAVDPFA